ncbi:MAG TPA: PRC-barrel domain-containing protein [Azospirillum sp.]|nr:PRC-barrel domain-containing protein [Azospirillum sp.]
MRKLLVPVLSAVALLSTAGCAQMQDMFGGTSSQAARPISERTTTSVASLTPQEMMGKNVITEDAQNVGAVEDVLMRNRNRASHVVVGTGGFLGMGERNVALDVDRLRWSGENNALVAMNMTPDQIASLPEYRYDGSMISLSRSRGATQ